MQPIGDRQGQLNHRLLAQISGVEQHQIAGEACAVPHRHQHPAVVFGWGCPAAGGARHHDRLAHKAPRGGAPEAALAGVQIELLDRLQGVVAALQTARTNAVKGADQLGRNRAAAGCESTPSSSTPTLRKALAQSARS